MADKVPATPNVPAINVQVIYAWPTHVWQRDVQLAPNATVQDALNKSGVLQAFPELLASLNTNSIGIYGRLADLHTRLHNHDRVELYRPLQVDPKESRRRRAAHRAARGQNNQSPQA